ncbi:hypothetical protein Ahy_A01g000424 [Arachis hypogaea]|uniref:Zinc finger PMZ-type domain-containing protein n=1 Tax=Arachis hypogaea TaxID=3818 RepID=A0A445EK64_ARAHY|nr:hypothetical protein Ahy_A01g000424 [Arachis hypogaea]
MVEELEPFEGWSQGSFRVQLSANTYDCGLFQSLHFSCRHALAICAVTNKKLCPEWYKTWLRPNPAMRRKVTRRPIFTRFCNEMDKAKRQEKQCGLCKQTGHTRRDYPNQPTEHT